ncbi:unnamed protein product, partial [Gulo gulo]
MTLSPCGSPVPNYPPILSPHQRAKGKRDQGRKTRKKGKERLWTGRLRSGYQPGKTRTDVF